MSRTAQLILASGSPRRRELLASLGTPFSVCPADVEEDLPERADRAERVARGIARGKAVAVAEQFPTAVVLAADTVVVLRGRLLGKPVDAGDAWAMLRALRGRWHRVITAVAVARRRRVWVSHVITRVQMREYTDDEIGAYIARGEPFDKAGAYAIQDMEFRPVATYDGCYCNVVGLPWPRAHQLLQRSEAVPFGSNQGVPLPECLSCPLVVAHVPEMITSSSP